MLLVALDPASPKPAYLQIRDRIASLVDDGTLRPGDRLPPTRGLASAAGVHRSTVVRAYEELGSLGYVESRSGSYTTVRLRARLPATHRAPALASPPAPAPAVDWPARAPASVRAALAAPDRHDSARVAVADCVDFERLAADPTLAPSGELRRCLKTVLAELGGAALDYEQPLGHAPLREAVASRLRAHGIAVGPGDILVTAGAQQALDLSLRLLTRPGDEVVVEAPSYGMMHALLLVHGLVPVEVPMRKDGMDLDMLEAALARRRPKALYTMPNFQNPTGITTSQAHRERLLALCEAHGVPVVEDGFEEEMKYTGKAVLPIKSMDERDAVLYVGTFSKVIFPGLRVGWIAAPRSALALLAVIQRASCLAGNTLTQAAVAAFCAHGQFEAYLRRVHRVYRRRMQTLLSSLSRHMPPGVEWTTPAGGYTLWLQLHGHAREEASICERLAAGGVRVAAGRRFFAGEPSAAFARLSIASVHETRINEGCRRLGRVLRTLR